MDAKIFIGKVHIVEWLRPRNVVAGGGSESRWVAEKLGRIAWCGFGQSSVALPNWGSYPTVSVERQS
jgi:hypothetical protein